MNWATEIDTVAPDEELALLELPPLGELDEELLRTPQRPGTKPATLMLQQPLS